MADEPDPIDQISFLTRSESRVRVLEQLLEAGPATQRELRTRLDASRSTIARALTALEQRDWIRRDDGAYRLTPIGKIVAEGFRDLADSIRVTDELSAFLSRFPRSEVDFDVAELRDSTVTTATPTDPYAPAAHQTELLQSADRFRGIIPAIDLDMCRLVHEEIDERNFDCEVVVGADVGETITNPDYARLFRKKLRTGRLRVFVRDEDLSLYVGLGDDDVVQICVQDDEGFPKALVETTSEPVFSWAESLYGEYCESAARRTLDDF